MTWPVASMGFVITMVQRAAASMDRLTSILDQDPQVSDSESTNMSMDKVRGAIRFRHVSFTYDGAATPSLQEINFEVAAGSTLAIVGRTGSGKTTLVEMISRVLDPTQGSVLVDGHDARTIPLDVLRSGIGYVPQDVFLFSDSIANNIAFGRMDAGEDAIHNAAEQADLLENVNQFSDGFQTFVGERGITLSGGQKQRVSIARALVRNPSILILDDALSAVDIDTERKILSNIRRQHGVRTIVIVSHRISAVQEADHIIVLEEGSIAESGNHRELIQHGGIYASLYQKQQLEAELEEMV